MKKDFEGNNPPLIQMGRLRAKQSRTKSMIASAKADSARRRKILPGYPIDSRFFTPDEIREYLDGEKIVCLLCGKMYRSVSGPHLKNVHGMSDDRYRERYGFPYTMPLCGTYKLQRASETGKKNYLEKKSGLRPKKSGEVYTGRTSVYAREQRKKNIKKAQENYDVEAVKKAMKKRRRLSDEQLKEILDSSEPHCILAKKYGVSDALIVCIRHGSQTNGIGTNKTIERFKMPTDEKTGRFKAK